MTVLAWVHRNDFQAELQVRQSCEFQGHGPVTVTVTHWVDSDSRRSRRVDRDCDDRRQLDFNASEL